MEERKFTLRISAEESAALEELKQLLSHETTDTGIIRYIIRNYKFLDERLKKEGQAKVKAEAELSFLRQKVDTFLSAFATLSKKQ